MNAPAKFIDFGQPVFSLDAAMYALVQRRVQIDRYLDHKSNVAHARKREAESAYASEWQEVAIDELALAAHCRGEALKHAKALREWR